MINVASISMLQERIPEKLLGRVFGALGALVTLAAPLGTGLAGLAADLLSTPVIFEAVGVLIAASGIYAIGAKPLREACGLSSTEESVA